MRQMHEVALNCSERLGRFQSAIYIWILPVVIKLLCDCNGEVNVLYTMFKITIQLMILFFFNF